MPLRPCVCARSIPCTHRLLLLLRDQQNNREVKLTQDMFASRWHVLSPEAAFERKQVLGGRRRSYEWADTSRAAVSGETREQRAQVMLNEARRAIDFCAATGDLTRIFRAKVKEAFSQAAGRESVGDDATDDLGAMNPSRGAGRASQASGARARASAEEAGGGAQASGAATGPHVANPQRSNKPGPATAKRKPSAGAAPRKPRGRGGRGGRGRG